jgi:DNA-binding transcriptional LysR family regulator
MLPCYTVVDALREGTLVHVLPRWWSLEIGAYMLIPSRRFLEAKTRAWLELLQSEISVGLERDAGFFDNSAIARK